MENANFLLTLLEINGIIYHVLPITYNEFSVHMKGLFKCILFSLFFGGGARCSLRVVNDIFTVTKCTMTCSFHFHCIIVYNLVPRDPII